MVASVKLMCIDEVHTVSEDRGSVLEVVVARMQLIGDAPRFIAVSATVPSMCILI